MDVFGTKAMEKAMLNALARQEAVNQLLSGTMTEITQRLMNLEASIEGINKELLKLETAQGIIDANEEEKYIRNVQLAAKARADKATYQATTQDALAQLALEFGVPIQSIRALATQFNISEHLLPLAGAYLRAHPEKLLELKSKISGGQASSASAP